MATSSGKEGDEHRSRLEVFAGSNPAGYRRWRRRAELFLLALPSNYSKERWGPKLLEFIQGEAEEALEDLSIEKVTAENGYKDILAILDDKYKELQQESLHRGLKEYFYQVMIKPGESYRNFMVRLDTAHRKLAEHGITLPEEVQGWFLMRKLGLDLPSESMVLTATSGSLKKSEVTKAIKAIFPQGKGGAVKRSDVFVLEELGEQGMTGAEAEQPPEEDGQEEVQEIFEIVADQVQQHSDYEEDEALDVFESYRDIKKKVQDKKTSRGFKGSGKAQGKGHMGGAWQLQGPLMAGSTSSRARQDATSVNSSGIGGANAPSGSKDVPGLPEEALQRQVRPRTTSTSQTFCPSTSTSPSTPWQKCWRWTT